MRTLARALVAGIVGGILLGLILAGAAHGAAPTGSAANQPGSWVTHLANDKGVTAQCFKHEPHEATVHGQVVGKGVVLATFDQSWFGDHWALLVVKGGNGNTVVYEPASGMSYFAPLNGGGNVPDVSHWIVCKGATPTPTTTVPPSTTIPPTTTTTPPSTTLPPVDCSERPPFDERRNCIPTTTIEEPPSTTLPPVLIDGEWPQTPHDPEPVVEITEAPAVLERPTELAFTGSNTKPAIAIALTFIIGGYALMRWSRIRTY